jgi:hypothetical protein
MPLAGPNSGANMTIHQIMQRLALRVERCATLPMMSERWLSTGILHAGAAFDAATPEGVEGSGGAR